MDKLIGFFKGITSKRTTRNLPREKNSRQIERRQFTCLFICVLQGRKSRKGTVSRDGYFFECLVVDYSNI
jgi:hypothetical protein